MNNSFIPTPSCDPLHPLTTQTPGNGLPSASYEWNCPYRRDAYGDAGLGLKFRIVEPLGAEGMPYVGDSFGDGQYIDTRDPRLCSDICLCRYHGRTESHFVFLAQKTKDMIDLIIYDATLYCRIAEVLGCDIAGSVFSAQGFSVDGFALLRNFEALRENLQALIQQEQLNHQDAYLVSSMRLLVDGFLGDEEVFRSFGHTYLHEQQHISFDLWKEFQASQALKDIELLDHGFHEAELGHASRPYEEEVTTVAEHSTGRRSAVEVGSTAAPTVKASRIKIRDQDSITISSSPKEPPHQSSAGDICVFSERSKEHDLPSNLRRLARLGTSAKHLEMAIIVFLTFTYPKEVGGALSDVGHKRFNPEDYLRHAAAQMEHVLQSAMEHCTEEAGQALIEFYLRYELFKSGNFEGVILDAAKNRCHWILNSVPQWAITHPLKLACLAAQHSAHRPLQPILETLSSIEPEVFRLCIGRAAKIKDTRSVQQLLRAAQNSKRLQHASMIWEAAMTGDAQMLWCIFGRGARMIILTLLQEAAQIRVRQIHSKFTESYPQFLGQLREASYRYSITMSGWGSPERLDSSVSAWNRGIIALKLLVRGRLPDQFSDVMLVLSIASVLSDTLDSTYTGNRKWSSAFLRDLPRWQTLLDDSLHTAYAYCVRGIWGVEVDETVRPELLSEGDLLDRFQGLAICLLRDTADFLELNENFSKNSLSSSQRRRAYLDLVDQTSEESPADSYPYHEDPTDFHGSWNDQNCDEIDPGPKEEADSYPQTRQAIIQGLHSPLPSQQVPSMSILIMMGAIFFCLLQFIFFLRLCRTSLPHMKGAPVSLQASPFGSGLLSKPLETLADKFDFLELYFGLDYRATKSQEQLKHGLSLTIFTPASANEPEVPRDKPHVDDQWEHRRSDVTLTSSAPQSISENSPLDNEHEPSPFSTSSAGSKAESTSASKPIHICTICSISFPTSSNFHRHKREKHKAGRFSCDRCGKNYSRATYAKIHKCRGKQLNAIVRAIRPRIS